MAGWVISKGLVNCVTVASPLARRARIARRVGSAMAVNAASRLNDSCIRHTLYKCTFIVKERFAAEMWNSRQRGQAQQMISTVGRERTQLDTDNPLRHRLAISLPAGRGV